MRKIPSEFWFALALTVLVIALMASCRTRTISTTLIPGDSTVTFSPGVVVTPADTARGSFDAVAFCDSLFRYQRDTVVIRDTVRIPLRTTSGRPAVGRITTDTSGRATLVVELDSLERVVDSLTRSVRRVDTLRVETTVNKCDSGFHRFAVTWFFGSVLVIGAALFLKFR